MFYFRLKFLPSAFNDASCTDEGFLFALKFKIPLPDDVQIQILGAEPVFIGEERTVITFKVTFYFQNDLFFIVKC